MRDISAARSPNARTAHELAQSSHRRARSFHDRGGIVASFYIRFEAAGLAERQDGLLLLLPGFVVYAGVVYFLFHLYEAKWRFTSLPDLMNIVRASTVLAVSLLVLDYVLVAPNMLGQFFFGKITIVLYWFLQMFFLGGPRIAYRYFRYTRARHHARAAEANADAGARPGRRRRSAAARHRKRRGQENLAGRHSVAVGGRSGPVRSAAFRCSAVSTSSSASWQRPAQRGTPVARVIFTPSRARAGRQAGNDPDAGAPARLDASRLPSLDEGGEALRLAPVNVEDLLLRPRVEDRLSPAGKLRERQGRSW